MELAAPADSVAGPTPDRVAFAERPAGFRPNSAGR